MELEDAVHTAILTLKEGYCVFAISCISYSLLISFLIIILRIILSATRRFEGQISGKNIEIGVISSDRKFR